MRVHPFPSRTRQLSSLALTILGRQRPGKISRRQHPKALNQYTVGCFSCCGGAFFVSMGVPVAQGEFLLPRRSRWGARRRGTFFSLGWSVPRCRRVSFMRFLGFVSMVAGFFSFTRAGIFPCRASRGGSSFAQRCAFYLPILHFSFSNRLILFSRDGTL